MNQTDEKAVKTAESLTEDTEKAAARSRWIDDEEAVTETTRKKKPYIQIPVIISLCLVVASLLAFFAFKYIFIAEPEGVVWKWHSDSDDIDYYFEFTDDNDFKAYFGSFEVTAAYDKDKSDSSINKLIISDPSMSMQGIGCFTFGEELSYTISGYRIAGDQELTISFPSDPTKEDIVLTQSDKWECPIELPDDFTEDEELTGEWINVFSSDNAKQTFEFNDDGSMTLAETYTFSGGQRAEIRRYCSYTVEKNEANEINITWIGKEPVVHHTEYVIKDGILYLDGSYFYRADNNPATPDES
ncbi:MAG: hypothetical protein IJ639_05805 [Ruminococcus sp.]|nr:hypothetical protein [Ruminococcus sp.]